MMKLSKQIDSDAVRRASLLAERRERLKQEREQAERREKEDKDSEALIEGKIAFRIVD